MKLNGASLIMEAPIEPMIGDKQKVHGTSYGLSEAGYDIRVQQTVVYVPPVVDAVIQIMKKIWFNGVNYEATQEDLEMLHGYTETYDPVHKTTVRKLGKTALLSSIEKFNIPKTMYCEFKNKSTHARHFADLSISTDADPGWAGYLTIEAVFHGLEPVTIRSGSGILTAVFTPVKHPANYGESPNSKYQDQPNEPIESKSSV